MVKEVKCIKVSIRGLTSLVVDKLSTNPNPITPEKKINDKLYFTKDGLIGFPAYGFMKGIITVSSHFDGFTNHQVRESIRVLGDIIPITYKDKIINVSGCRGCRPELTEWSCELEVMYNADVISEEQIINLLNYAGFHQGIGSWRPAHAGSYGQYKVQELQESNPAFLI